ncbi:MAG: hypothetical protein EPO09_07200 [Aquabacterium sp.]|uniref:hypothetical protein n=1 Tax=Aquabacterium sp. TaxID=1872578 RepID=UPI00121E67AB|nr:hypothetical protein [Aquabacterium sp.]TAK95910.1 MAG: hypothetical protein EPO09_07200 [Aquabacterium sp.]
MPPDSADSIRSLLELSPHVHEALVRESEDIWVSVAPHDRARYEASGTPLILCDAESLIPVIVLNAVAAIALDLSDSRLLLLPLIAKDLFSRVQQVLPTRLSVMAISLGPDFHLKESLHDELLEEGFYVLTPNMEPAFLGMSALQVASLFVRRTYANALESINNIERIAAENASEVSSFNHQYTNKKRGRL